MFTRFARWGWLISALLLTACNLQFRTAIGPDEGGVYALEVGFLPADLQMLETLDTTLEEFCAETQQSDELPAGSTARVEERAGAQWCVLEMPFADLAALTKYYDEMEGLTVNQLEVKDGELIYDLTLTFDAEAFNNAAGGEGVEMTWEVALPGQLGEHNATQVEGNTLTWVITPGEPVNFKARSRVSGFGLPNLGLNSPMALMVGGLLLGCGCLLVLLALGGGIFWFTRRKGAVNSEHTF